MFSRKKFMASKNKQKKQSETKFCKTMEYELEYEGDMKGYEKFLNLKFKFQQKLNLFKAF